MLDLDFKIIDFLKFNDEKIDSNSLLYLIFHKYLIDLLKLIANFC